LVAAAGGCGATIAQHGNSGSQRAVMQVFSVASGCHIGKNDQISAQ
jgi:hypothetical protein